MVMKEPFSQIVLQPQSQEPCLNQMVVEEKEAVDMGDLFGGDDDYWYHSMIPISVKYD